MAIIKPAARLVWFFGVTFDPGLAAQMSRESNIGRSMLQGMGAEESAGFLEEKPETYIRGPEPYDR